MLRLPHTVCTSGEVLSPEQATILVRLDLRARAVPILCGAHAATQKLLGNPMADFRVELLRLWTKGEPAVEVLAAGGRE